MRRQGGDEEVLAADVHLVGPHVFFRMTCVPSLIRQLSQVVIMYGRYELGLSKAYFD